MKFQAVVLYPFGKLPGAHTLVPLRGGSVHQKAVAGGSAQRIDNINIPLGKSFLHYQGGVAGGVYGAGDAGGQAHMDNIQPLLQKGRKIVHIFGDVHLGCTGVRASFYSGVKLVKGHASAQIVRIFHAVNGIMEANIMYVAALKMFLCQVGGGAAAQNIVTHTFSPFCFWFPSAYTDRI